MINAQQVQGSWNQIRGKLKEKWGNLSDDDLKIVGGNVDQVIGRIQQKTGAMRENIESFINELTEGGSMADRARETVSQYAQQVGDRAREGYQQVSDRAREGYQQVSDQARGAYSGAEHMLQRRPAESMATVFGAGVVAGVVLGLMMRHD